MLLPDICQLTGVIIAAKEQQVVTARDISPPCEFMIPLVVIHLVPLFDECSSGTPRPASENHVSSRSSNPGHVGAQARVTSVLVFWVHGKNLFSSVLGPCGTKKQTDRQSDSQNDTHQH